MKKTILLLDDSAIVVKSLKKVLNNWGYKVKGITDPLDAIVSVKTNNYSLVIVDLYMPRFCGYRFLKQLSKEKENQQCCLMTSAELDEPLLKKSLALDNVKWFLKKPVSVEKLQLILSEAITT